MVGPAGRSRNSLRQSAASPRCGRASRSALSAASSRSAANLRSSLAISGERNARSRRQSAASRSHTSIFFCMVLIKHGPLKFGFKHGALIWFRSKLVNQRQPKRSSSALARSSNSLANSRSFRLTVASVVAFASRRHRSACSRSICELFEASGISTITSGRTPMIPSEAHLPGAERKGYPAAHLIETTALPR